MSNHFHILLHAKDDTVGNIVKRIASSYVYYEFTSWHEYLGRADFFPLCNVNVVLGRISIDEQAGQVTGHCPELPPTSPTANRAHRAGGLQETIKSLQWNAFFYWI